jgi:hypothetical protein
MPPASELSQAYEISDRVTRQALIRASQRDPGAPHSRPLRIYTLDPSLSDRLGGIAIVNVPYEKLQPGPVGALFRVNCEGAPELLRATALDLDDPHLLLSAGLSPSPADGRFHPQMVYAVCSLTYAAFSRALGRDIAWATQHTGEGPLRLTVRPFGFRGANAGYSREAGDLSFGYFTARGRRAGFTLQNGLICTALSHDIIAHETTHALLDGLRSAFMTPTHVDVPAFHEGFSDLVALFLHFTYPGVVERAIRDLYQSDAGGTVLADVAREFGYARSRSGKGRALRSGLDVDGIAAFDSDAPPGAGHDPAAYDAALEPHALGSVLVSAVFEAFTTIVRRKTERLFRIAGVDPRPRSGRTLSDALVEAVAQEASDVAGQFLNLCIRAVDYCPPADMELGEYLRALITADAEMERADKWGYREALMRSFRRRNIFPDHVRFMTEDAVRWSSPSERLRMPGLAFSRLRFEGDPGQPAGAAELRRQADALGRFVTDPRHAAAFQLVPPGTRLPKGIVQAPPPTVQSIRVARRAAPDGRILFDTVAEVTQTCTMQHEGDYFEMTGGSTIVIDPMGEVRYVVYKRLTSEERRARQHAAIRGALAPLWERTSRRVYRQRPQMLRRLHELAAAGGGPKPGRRK